MDRQLRISTVRYIDIECDSGIHINELGGGCHRAGVGRDGGLL